MMQPMPRVPPFDRPATYDDLVKLPDNLVAEIVDGELHASPRPALPHADAGSALGGVLMPAFGWGRGGPGGWWIVDEPELHLGTDVLVPDLAGWRRARIPHRPDTTYVAIPLIGRAKSSHHRRFRSIARGSWESMLGRVWGTRGLSIRRRGCSRSSAARQDVGCFSVLISATRWCALNPSRRSISNWRSSGRSRPAHRPDRACRVD